MYLALDYDNTYTRDPEFWDEVIELAKDRGHKIVCVTMRREDEVDQKLFPKIPVVCTNRKAKWFYAEEIGMRVDVWVDDSPWFLLNNG